MAVEREERRHVRVVVIGTGFGGLGAGVRLRREGITDFVILERADSVGGTWRDNSYPGCACDVPSHLYSFSFAPNATWPRASPASRTSARTWSTSPTRSGCAPSCASTPRCTRRVGTTRRGAGGTDHLAGRVDRGRAGLGGRAAVRPADAGYSRAGRLPRPGVPLGALGPRVRPRRASASPSSAPAPRRSRSCRSIQPEAARLTVLPAHARRGSCRAVDRGINAVERWLHSTVPATQRLAPASCCRWCREFQVGAFVKRPAAAARPPQQTGASTTCAGAVKDPELRAKLTPRLHHRLQADPALQRLLSGARPAQRRSGHRRARRGPRLHHRRRRRHRARGRRDHLRHRLPRHRHADRRPACRRATAAPWPSTGGGGMAALRGRTVDGFPNLCFVIGPNTGLGNNSMVLMIESAAQLHRRLRRHRWNAPAPPRCDARTEAARSWNEAACSSGWTRTVWNTGGCRSWYLDDERPQHHAVARLHRAVPPGHPPGEARRVRDRSRPPRPRRPAPPSPGVSVTAIEPTTYPPAPRRPGCASSRPTAPAAATRGARTRGRADRGAHPRLDLLDPRSGRRSSRELAAAGHRVVAYDQRGHGRSDVPADRARYSTDALADDLEAVLCGGAAGRRAGRAGRALHGRDDDHGRRRPAGGRHPHRRRAAGQHRPPATAAEQPGVAGPLPQPPGARRCPPHPAAAPAAARPGGPLLRAALKYGVMAPGSTPEQAAFTTDVVHACGRQAPGGLGPGAVRTRPRTPGWPGWTRPSRSWSAPRTGSPRRCTRPDGRRAAALQGVTELPGARPHDADRGPGAVADADPRAGPRPLAAPDGSMTDGRTPEGRRVGMSRSSRRPGRRGHRRGPRGRRAAGPYASPTAARKVALVGLEPAELAGTAEASATPKVHWDADVTDQAAMTRVAAEVAEAFGRVDVAGRQRRHRHRRAVPRRRRGHVRPGDRGQPAGQHRHRPRLPARAGRQRAATSCRSPRWPR